MMMRWTRRLAAGLLLLSGMSGCKQPLYVNVDDHQTVLKTGLPAEAEYDAGLSYAPPRMTTPEPATVLDPDRPIRYISLQEAISIALEQGNIGFQSAVSNGQNIDTLVSFTGRGVAGDDSIKVLSLDPAIAAADIEAALSKFDARWISSLTWNKRDDAIINVLQNFQNGDQASFSTSLVKPLPTGGVAGITLSTDYQRLSQPPEQFQFINPAYRPRLQALFEQPLLQGWGIDINQLAVTHPGSRLVPGLRPSGGGTRTEGILLTRIRYDQSRAELERNVNYMLYNVEAAYWNLYGAYYNLFARETGMRQAFVVWKLTRARVLAGKDPQQKLDQARAQFELFRAQRVQAVGQVLENERQLRGLLGMPGEDGTRLVPSDTPTLAPYKPDWEAALQEALQLRPELVLCRQELRARQLDLILQKNFLRPDLRFTASYDINGIGPRLDGKGADENALANMMSGQFHSWSLGLSLDVPLGTRDAHAAVRVAKLNLARQYAILRDQELKAERYLARQYRQLFEFHEQTKALRAQREANASYLELQVRRVDIGQESIIDANLLFAERDFVDALAQEYQAIVNYNIALAAFQFGKGTIMAYNNVIINDGPLPDVALARAVEHQRERTKALVLRERAKPLLDPTLHPPALPNLFEHRQPPPERLEDGVEMEKAPAPIRKGEPNVESSPTSSSKTNSVSSSAVPGLPPTRQLSANGPSFGGLTPTAPQVLPTSGNGSSTATIPVYDRKDGK